MESGLPSPAFLLEVTFASYEMSHYLSVQKDYPLLLINSELSDQNGMPSWPVRPICSRRQVQDDLVTLDAACVH